MNIETELKKAGLTREQYESLMNDVQDKINGVNDLDWAEIISKYDLKVSYDYLRHAVLSKPFGAAFAREYYENKEDVPQTYVEQMDKIRKEKQKLSDERMALRKLSREDARAEENLNMLADLIRENGQNIFVPVDITVEDNGNDILACLSDFHLGIDTETTFGKYNSDIARERICNYLLEILRIQKVHCSQNIHVGILGDIINGGIHPTVQLENRENVVQQVQMAAEYISAFLYELSKHFENVYVADVGGNHSRIGLKENCLRDERLDDLIVWYAKAKLEHIPSIHFVDEKYDATIASMTIRGKEFILIHGDYDAYSETGVNKLCMFIGHRPSGGILMGHLHHCTFDDINDVKVIRSGSFSGTCDNYTIQKRLYSRPSQMVCVVDRNGVKAFYPVTLD